MAETKKDERFSIAKLDPDRNLVFGWASVAATVDGQTLIDKQGDIIPPEELETAAYEYVLEFREADEMHTRVTKGHLVESFVSTPEKARAMGLPDKALPTGWWVGFKMDPATFAAVKAGTYPMFSIEGTAERVEVDKYDPNQPRDPGGPGGGQWIAAGGGMPDWSAPSRFDRARWKWKVGDRGQAPGPSGVGGYQVEVVRVKDKTLTVRQLGGASEWDVPRDKMRWLDNNRKPDEK